MMNQTQETLLQVATRILAGGRQDPLDRPRPLDTEDSKKARLGYRRTTINERVEDAIDQAKALIKAVRQDTP